jgi:ATP-binding cassette subfamily F protein 3
LIDINKSFDGNEVIRNTTLFIERGDKIALIGANGKGKSTLLRIINGGESFKGEREEGYNVVEAFYAQHQIEALSIENEMLEELKMAGSGKSELELRNLLGCFLFTGDDVYKKIKVLSGGEKSRVALAKTLTSEANFLLLDEPTNHLDFISENILIQALQQFKGTFVAVSHNRHFISRVANKIWYIEDKVIKEYPGTYDEFTWWDKKRTENKSSQKIKAEGETKTSKKKVQKNKSNKDATDSQNETEARIKSLEKKIESLETQKKELEEKMTSPDVFSNPDKLQEINQLYQKTGADLHTHAAEWDELVSQLTGN